MHRRRPPLARPSASGALAYSTGVFNPLRTQGWSPRRHGHGGLFTTLPVLAVSDLTDARVSLGRAGSLATRNPTLFFSFVGVLWFIQIAVSAGLVAAVLQLLGEVHAFEFPAAKNPATGARLTSFCQRCLWVRAMRLEIRELVLAEICLFEDGKENSGVNIPQCVSAGRFAFRPDSAERDGSHSAAVSRNRPVSACAALDSLCAALAYLHACQHGFGLGGHGFPKRTFFVNPADRLWSLASD